MALSTAPRQRERPLWSAPASHSDPPLGAPSVLVAESSLLLTVFIIAMGILLAIVAFVCIRSIGDPSYQATIEGIMPSGSSQVIVNVQVQNLGSSPATPTCDVEVSSSAAAFTGAGTFTVDRPIPAGLSVQYDLLVQVTSDGATNVNASSSSASCHS